MSLKTPVQIAEITGTTTYTGSWRLFWINIHATAAAVITLSDGATELMSIGVPTDTSVYTRFTPSITVITSLVVTKSSGTVKITTARAPS